MTGGPLAALAADVIPHGVLAHGTDDRFWVGQVSAAPGIPASLHTTIYYRLLGQSGKWQPLTRSPIPARVVSLANQGQLAAAMLEDGQWMLLYPDSSPITAGPLPPPARMVALAGGRNAWWAVGVVPGGISAAGAATRASTTQPGTATQRTVTVRSSDGSSIRPQSRPAGSERLVLFQLAGNDWTPRAELPGDVPAKPAVALALFDGVPYVADLDDRGALRLQHLDNARWLDDARLADLPRLAAFKWLGESAPARLWAQPIVGNERIYVLGPRSQPPIELAPIPDTSAADRSIALALGELRMIGQVKDTLVEQRFALDTGKPDGPRTDLALPRTSALELLQTLQTIVVTAALVFVAYAWFGQRARREQALRAEQLKLAPTGRRLLAGLIDASPVIVAVLAVSARYGAASTAPEQTRQLILVIVYWCAALFYILYTTLIEALAGRTLGKVLIGLRVVGLDGKPARPSALVIRNVLRVIDVGLFFLPVLMVPSLPLRQRLGDLAAGTLVVMGDAEKSGPEQTEKPQSPDGDPR